ncbi:MAG: hypothetical protein F6K30_12115 [Cyanothece sp. SIO2G6]|nr:hypothetical protein [Cyanothece sp. SIO2G6]
MFNLRFFHLLKSVTRKGQRFPFPSVRPVSVRSSAAAIVAAGVLCCYSPTLTATALAQTGPATDDALVSEMLLAAPSSSHGSSQSSKSEAQTSANQPHLVNLSVDPSLNVDPIGSPHPLPWSWVTDIQSRPFTSHLPQLFYYRSPALMSPDGDWAAYSRMQVRRVIDASQSQVSSILFLENMETGAIQFLTASSPAMQHVSLNGTDSQQPGMLSMLMPISWTETGDRVLVRAFEAIFNTDIAADYAIVWHQASNQAEAVVPTNAQYSNAILLGWSRNQPDRLLFQMGNLGDETWPLVTVGNTGDNTIATVDQPITYGQTVSAVWNGPQISALDATVVD